MCAEVADRQFDDFRYNAYVKKVLPSRKSAVNLASLPPTYDVATQRVSRSFQQKQVCLNLKPELNN